MLKRQPLVRLAVLALAVLILYGSGLDHTPPHLHRDEVVISLQAHAIASTGRDLDGRLMPLYFRMGHLGEDVWFHPLIVYVTALFLQVLPVTEPAFRFPTAVIATINVVLMYFVAHRLFGTERWALVAAALLAMTPAHFLHGRLAFDFIYPLPFVLAWLLGLQAFLGTQRLWTLFLAASALGVGVYSYIASVIMMPLYLVLTCVVLLLTRTMSMRALAVAASGFCWPLLLWIPWMMAEPSFALDVLSRYGVGGVDFDAPRETQSMRDVVQGIVTRVNYGEIIQRISLYWAFLDPAFLFLSGGFTRMTNSTRLVGVFLAPFLVLIPYGLVHMVTARRSAMGLAIFLGFILAPLAACLTVKEPYASDRELAVLVFGALIATSGVERLCALTSRLGRGVAVGVLALIPLHFMFFQVHYFGDYHRRSAFWFEWNHKDGLEAIVAHQDPAMPRPVYLTTRYEKHIGAWWELTLVKLHRRDLLQHTVYFDAQDLDVATVPAGALMLATRDELPLLVGSGRLREVMHAPEPGDDPVFFVLER